MLRTPSLVQVQGEKAARGNEGATLEPWADVVPLTPLHVVRHNLVQQVDLQLQGHVHHANTGKRHARGESNGHDDLAHTDTQALFEYRASSLIVSPVLAEGSATSS